MSFAVDSNIWICGLDSASPRHKPARAFLTERLSCGEGWTITWSIVYEVLRVLTHPAVTTRPATPAALEGEFFRFVDEAGIRVLPETENHREFLTMVLRDCGGARGNFWHDCHIAATLLEHGTNVIYTCDRDFRKLTLLKSIDPLA